MSALSFAKDDKSRQLSAAFKQKILANRSGRNEALTAAQSQSLEQTLARDASRQYIDVNFSIGESLTGQVGKMHEQSQVLPRNQSLSKISDSIANYSDVNMAKKGLRMAPSSLYDQNAAPYQSRIRTITGRPSQAKKPALSLSQALKKPRDQANWKAQRRASE